MHSREEAPIEFAGCFMHKIGTGGREEGGENRPITA